MLAHAGRERREPFGAHLVRVRVRVKNEGRGARVRGGGHGGTSCLGCLGCLGGKGQLPRRQGGSCLGGTSKTSEISDSPSELRQRTRKQKAWSFRNPAKRLELTWYT